MDKIFWVDLNRFDTRIDKSTYIEVCNEFIRKGYDLLYLTGFEKEKLYMKECLFRIAYFGIPQIPFVFRAILLIKILAFIFKHAKKGDLVIIQPPALFMAPFIRKKGIRLHLDIRTVPTDINSLKERIDQFVSWKLAMKLFRKSADSYSFITTALKKQVEIEFGDQFTDFVIWTSAVNTSLFDIMEPTENASDKPFLIFYHGHVTRKRGFPELIKAISILVEKGYDDYQVKVVGAGNDIPMLKQLADNLHVLNHFEFTGLMPYDRMPLMIAEADICVCILPDRIEWNVSSPLKVFEYLACGKPVICTPIPAHKDVLGDMEGIVYTGGYDEVAIADAILLARSEIGALKTKAHELRGYVVNNYTWVIQAGLLITYLQNKKII